MTAARSCAACGVSVPLAAGEEQVRFCGHCGAALADTPEVSAASDSTSAPEPDEDPESRLRRLHEHPQLEQLLRAEPSASSPTEMARGLAMLTAFVIVSLLCAMLAAAFFPPLLLLPLAALAFGLYGLVSTGLQQRRTARLPLERSPALVLDVHTSIRGLGGAAGRTDLLVSLRSPDGTTRRARVEASLAEHLTSGTVGVAFEKGSWLIDFQAVTIADAPT